MFRLVNVGGRPALEHAGGAYDVARLAEDDSLATAAACLARFEELHELARRCDGAEPDGRLDEVVLGPPVPDARQVFGIGLNYKSHAEESGMELPPAPLTFTKFPSCLAGPTADVPLSGAVVDYEAEVVVVIGRTCRGRHRGRRLGRGRRGDRRPGHLRPRGTAHRLTTAVLPGQELRRLWADRTRRRVSSTPSRTPTTSRCAARCGVTWSRSPRRRS